MDEYNRGMDPELKKYFRKIMNSFFMGLLWLLAMATAGFYFGLAEMPGGPKWYNILFYLVFIGSFLALVRYFYKRWK